MRNRENTHKTNSKMADTGPKSSYFKGKWPKYFSLKAEWQLNTKKLYAKLYAVLNMKTFRRICQNSHQARINLIN